MKLNIPESKFEIRVYEARSLKNRPLLSVLSEQCRRFNDIRHTVYGPQVTSDHKTCVSAFEKRSTLADITYF